MHGESGFFDFEADAIEAGELLFELLGGVSEQAALIAIGESDAMAARILDGIALAADVADASQANALADVGETAAADDADENVVSDKVGECFAGGLAETY
jgi:hypothetical protein